MLSMCANFLQETYLKRSLKLVFKDIYIYIDYIYTLAILYTCIYINLLYITYIIYKYLCDFLYFRTFIYIKVEFFMYIDEISLTHTEINANVCSVTSELSQSSSKRFRFLRSYQSFETPGFVVNVTK